MKRLRYALEFLAPLYPKAAARLLPRLVALQDGLGRRQDAVIAARQFRMLAHVDQGLPPGTRLAMGELAALNGAPRSSPSGRASRRPTRPCAASRGAA